MDFPTYSYVSRRLLKTRARHAKTLIRMLANGRENRECKKSEKQVRKQYATAATEKEVIQVEDWNGSATSVSHQDSDIKGPTKPHLSPHISHLYLHYISFSSLSLSLQGQRSRPLQVSRTSPLGEPADSETRCVPQGRVQMCFMHTVSCADLYVVPGISTLRLWPRPRWGRNQWREPEGGGPASSVETSSFNRRASSVDLYEVLRMSTPIYGRKPTTRTLERVSYYSGIQCRPFRGPQDKYSLFWDETNDTNSTSLLYC